MKTYVSRLKCSLGKSKDWLPTSWKKAAISLSLAGAIGLTGIISGCKPSQPPVTPPPITQPTPATNPVEEYAKGLRLSDEFISWLKPLGEDEIMDKNEKGLIDELYILPGEVQKDAKTLSILENITKDGDVTSEELARFQDLDQDGVSNRDELSVYQTNPLVAEAWNDFDTVTSILNTPTKVSLYLKREFLEVRKPSQLFAVPVAELFKDRSGDCDEYAMLALYWLTKNSYEAYMVDVYFNKWWQEYNQWLEHDICVYKGKDGLWYSIDIYDNSSGHNPAGPFESIDKICDRLPSHYGATNWISYKLFDSSGKAVKTVTAEQITQDFLGPNARKIYTFEQIVPLLDTPDKVSTFMKNNIKWDGDYDNRVCGGNQYDPAWIVYQHGIDDCDGHAILQAYLLEKNGWDAYVIGLSMEAPVLGHNVAGVNLSDGKILVLDNEGLERGPFDSLSEVAQFYIKLGWMTAGGSLRTIRASQITEVMTGGSVLRLPWTFHSY